MLSTCPTRKIIEADVAELLGASAFVDPEAASVIVRGVVTEDRVRGVLVELEARDARGVSLGQRSLSAPAGECASLRDAIAFVLTLFVEQYGSAAPGEDGWVFGLGVTASVANTPMPSPAASLGAAVAFIHGRALEFQAAASYWPATAVRTQRGLGAQLEAFSLGARTCLSLWGGLGLCAGLSGGALIATPLELQGPARQARMLANTSFHARFVVQPLEGVQLDAALGPTLALSRPEFSYRNADGERVGLYRPALVGVGLRISIIMLAE